MLRIETLKISEHYLRFYTNLGGKNDFFTMGCLPLNAGIFNIINGILVSLVLTASHEAL